MKRFFVDSSSYVGVISTNNMFKLISTVDNVMGDCYEIPIGTTLRQCLNAWNKINSKMIYSAHDPFCCIEKPEYGFNLDYEGIDENEDPSGKLFFVDLKTKERKILDFKNTFELKLR